MNFQPEKESWDAYTERLQHFFTATHMTDDGKKAFTLIHQNGPSLYTLLKELCFPRNPTHMSYEEIVDILRRHYVGAKSVYCERKVFYNAQMRPYESASEWHRRLRALVINCNFGGFVEEILLDKFVTGFQGKILRRLYEENENLSLQQALEISQRHENDLFSEENKKKMSSECGQTPQQHQKHQSKVNYKEQSLQQGNQQKKVITCTKCGKIGHYANVCRSSSRNRKEQSQEYVYVEEPQPAKVPTCYKCGKKGHYANVCHSRSTNRREENTSECCIS